MIPLSARLSSLAADAELLLVDVWGVLHDGVTAHPEAGAALARFRAGGGFVVLVSNAPRSGEIVVGFLDRLGVPQEAYDAVVTSGDVSRSLIAGGEWRSLAYVGPDKDRSIFAGLAVRETSLEEAELLLCAGLGDDETETPADYAGRLAQAKARGLPMICANPDLVVERGPQLVWCAGAIAEDYAGLGGRVIWTGKPHAIIYEAALDIAQLSRGRAIPRDRILAIGDAIRTDIAGARGLGVRSLMIADGIHARDLMRGDGVIDARKAETFLAEAAFRPTALAPRLIW